MTSAVSVESWSGKDRADENFPVGSALIRPDLRPHVHAFYAFARNADDIADSPALTPEDKLFRLKVMEDVLLGASDDGAPSAIALRASLAKTNTTTRHACDLLAAFRQDAEKTRYEDSAELMDYCRLSAMPVGRHVLDLHAEDPASHTPSDPLCAALQILNHLQDCAKDLAQLDRCYLPLDLLAANGCSVETLRQPRETAGLRRVFMALLDQVDDLNRQADDLPRRVRDRRLRLETAVIVGLAKRLARRLRHGDPLATRVRLTRPGCRGLRAVVTAVSAGMTALGAAQADLDAVDGIVRAAGTSFYRGMRILPPDRRVAMYAIYAFCRQVDDIADDERPFGEKQPALAAWRARVAGLYAGQADDAVTRVLVLAVKEFDLRQADFIAVIDGMEMDAATEIVAPDLETLDLYCDRVASAVGRLSVRAFGDATPTADLVAFSLGRALQLTNILRDVAEDAGRNRLYLPREWLEQANVPLDPHGALAAPGLAQVCARVAALANRHFADAAAAMRRCDKKAMRPARLMGATYAAILSRLERRGWSRQDLRVNVPTWQKLWLALRYGVLG